MNWVLMADVCRTELPRIAIHNDSLVLLNSDGFPVAYVQPLGYTGYAYRSTVRDTKNKWREYWQSDTLDIEDAKCWVERELALQSPNQLSMF